ncbi:unnamed protein product [Taenia asiatica]|uniref:Uncharacterized protein n=1 Tax=Taenia asiatica TaxID=60517 RepID=A0A0R3W5Y2_TAEAS|nr:unnamed protein product [Taenia asiatica]
MGSKTDNNVVSASNVHFKSGIQVDMIDGDLLRAVPLATAMCQSPTDARVEHEGDDEEEGASSYSFYAYLSVHPSKNLPLELTKRLLAKLCFCFDSRK